MNARRLLLNSLFYYWRTNLAVLLGVVAGTAVIGGALIVGDSVRGSLRAMTLVRLGEVDHVVNSQRFFREQLADELDGLEAFQTRFAAVAPAIAIPGSVESGQEGSSDGAAIRRAGPVNIYGIDERFWDLTDHGDAAAPTDNEVVLNSRLAEELGAAAGDEVTLWIEIPASIPRDALLGDRDESSAEVVLTVSRVLAEASGVGRFELNPNQHLPLDAFVALDELQSRLGLAEVRRSPRNPIAKPARVNALFISARDESDRTGAGATDAADELSSLLSGAVDLEDLSLRVVKHEERNYLALESQQMFLENGIATVAEDTAEQLSMPQSPVLVYLANEIANTANRDAFSMYSVIAGIDLQSVDAAPFGPLVYEGSSPEGSLESSEILINDWLAEDLQAGIGDDVTVSYHVVGSHGELPEVERQFQVAGILDLEGTPAADRGFTPELEGITDVESYDDWDEPFPMKLNRVTDRDDEYWERYRATPKAFLPLDAAQELWRSRYGNLTSLRLAAPERQSLDETAAKFEKEFLAALEAENTGLFVQPVKWAGLQAASGTTDFTGLFAAFSFFLILSATILISLLFRLGIERRASNIGLMSAVGIAPAQVRRLYLAEGLIVVVIGGLLGTLAAVAYASLMVYGLTTWWIGAIGTRFLEVYVEPVSLITGFVSSVAIVAAVVWWALRQLKSVSTRELLVGQSQQALSTAAQQRRGRMALKVALASTGTALLLVAAALVGLIPASEAFSGFSWQIVAFFVVGMAMLTASLSLLAYWLDSDKSAAVRGAGLAAVGRLGTRNAARHRQRSVLTVGLIASATFVIVAVAAGHRNPAAETPDKQSGNGGYTLVATSTSPLIQNLNSAVGRDELDIIVDDGSASAELLEQMQVMSFRVKPGEEASCLNIYQTTLPTILGVPQAMIERGGFKFAGTKGNNPWTLLNERPADGSIPVLGDMNTLMYSLHKGVGGTVFVPNEDNPEHTLSIAGMFDGSVFQGVLLMSEENFHKVFPNQGGYQYFLIEVDSSQANDLSQLLETKLSPFGFDAERVAVRLANFLAVQNTYLSTFQTLGGLGLLLGTLGLATVMLRNVLERRGELALLRAVGFRNTHLAGLVLWENAFLLMWGLLAGSLSALLAMAPHLRTTGADVPWLSSAIILGGVFVVGMAAALAAVAEAIRTPILATLRSE